uniref:Putative homing endonuclease n=1 Tax=viral metagenome TaxID=1070528 RepID=A0A6M3IUW1_9ZZZZ
MTRKLTPKEQVDIVTAFTVDLEPVVNLAEKHHRTRQGIYKLLQKHGIDPAEYGHIAVTCSACGQPVIKNRACVRNRRHIFCNTECYHAFIEGRQQGFYKGWEARRSIARIVVSRYFDLQPEHVVHHEDRNTANNHPRNLRVFANQGDHTRYHKWTQDGVEITPLWDGSKP